MNRRDFVLTLIGASGTVAAGGAYALDFDPASGGDGDTPNASDGGETAAMSTATTTESPPGSSASTETGTATDTESPTTTSTEPTTTTPSETPPETRRPIRTETSSPTRTHNPTPTGTQTPNPREGIKLDAKSESSDDKRLKVKVTNTNDDAVYVEITATWRFEDGGTDSERRGGIVSGSGSDTWHVFTVRRGTVTDWTVELSSVRRI